MKNKTPELTPELYDYVCKQRSLADDSTLESLRAETEALGDISRMLISREQGSFLTLLVAAVGARNAIEVGTFTGYSAICIARGLPANGHLTCIDIEERPLTRAFWKKANVEKQIDFRVGAANRELRKFPDAEQFDFAFIDADKTGYDAYYELLLPKMKPNALFVFDNMLHGGHVLAPESEDDAALDRLNDKLANDQRVESVLLPLADGIAIARKH